MPLREQAIDRRKGIGRGSVSVDANGPGLFAGSCSGDIDLFEIDIGAPDCPTAV